MSSPKHTPLFTLLAVERHSKAYSWATFFCDGKTQNADLAHIEFQKRRGGIAEASFTETIITEHYTRISAKILGTQRQIESICLSLGIGTIATPIPPDSSTDN